jgi:putative sterol carrier protein
MSEQLLDNLTRFASEVNNNKRLRNLLKNWEPVIRIHTNDTNDAYYFPIRDTFIGNIETGDTEADHQVLLKADCHVLEQVFTGALNPARAHLDGALDVYGSDKDEVKLDAISLVLWGI